MAMGTAQFSLEPQLSPYSKTIIVSAALFPNRLKPLLVTISCTLFLTTPLRVAIINCMAFFTISYMNFLMKPLRVAITNGIALFMHLLLLLFEAIPSASLSPPLLVAISCMNFLGKLLRMAIINCMAFVTIFCMNIVSKPLRVAIKS